MPLNWCAYVHSGRSVGRSDLPCKFGVYVTVLFLVGHGGVLPNFQQVIGLSFAFVRVASPGEFRSIGHRPYFSLSRKHAFGNNPGQPNEYDRL